MLALLDGEFTVKRYRRSDAVVTLVPENAQLRAYHYTEERTFEVWGVVTRSIRML